MKKEFAKQAAPAINPAPQAQAKQPAPQNRDSLLGSMLFDAIFGVSLSELLDTDFATDFAQDLDMDSPAMTVGTATTLYDEAARDLSKKSGTNGSYELGVSGSMNKSFNIACANESIPAPAPTYRAEVLRMKRHPGLYMAA
jgi:predicted lipid-binding transport protein (Tim44 family)